MAAKIAYPWFYFYRIARLSLLVFLPTLVLLLIIYRSTYKSGLITQMTIQTQESMHTTLFTLKKAGLAPLAWCDALPHDQEVRFSLIGKDGIILCDTLDGRKGEKVKDNTEVESAFKEGFFSSTRQSDQVKGRALFAALKVSDHLVLRKVVAINSLKDDFNRFDRVLFFRIVPFALVSYLIFLILFFRATRPLGSVLAKVQKFKDDIPFGKSLALLYKKDEWAHIEEALNKADKRLQDQVAQAKTENEKISAILDSIYDDIIAVDKFDTVLFFNENFKRNFIQSQTRPELLPKLWRTFSDEAVLQAFRSVVSTGRTTSLKGLKQLSKTSPQRIFDLTVTPLKSGEGSIIGALGVLYDVTELRLTEQMRVDFVANVSHEIRTPLTSIKGFTQVLQSQKDKIDPELHNFLSKIVSNTERLIALFNDLLNLSVIESHGPMKKETISLNEIVDFVVESIGANYSQLDLIVERDLAVTEIKGESRLMEQVISNLFDNACKYSERSDVRIKIVSRAIDDKIRINISDNGPGVAKEHEQRIFERFYRVDYSREELRGTGLGLSIVKHIINNHGGKIWALKEQSGMNFVIELPLA
jgi:two-component system phosphate regulon sensor histidine kinase PhoR